MKRCGCLADLPSEKQRSADNSGAFPISILGASELLVPQPSTAEMVTNHELGELHEWYRGARLDRQLQEQDRSNCPGELQPTVSRRRFLAGSQLATACG